MFNIFKLLKKNVKINQKYPLTKEELNDIYCNKDECPDCGMSIYKYMLMGPEGGGAVNIKCSYCGSFFNDMGPFGIDRIRWIDHHHQFNLWLEDNKGSILMKTPSPFTKMYTPYTPKIIQSWNTVIVSDKATKQWTELYNFCYENCSKKWSVKSGIVKNNKIVNNSQNGGTFFFEDESEAILFRLFVN